MKTHDFIESVLEMTDSYKVSHWLQTPKDTKKVFSFFESRISKNGEKSPYSEVLFFGLQYYLKRYLEGEVVNKEAIEYGEDYFNDHFGRPDLFNRKGWEHIVNKYGGMLPVEILAAPEGLVVPRGNALMTGVNTDDKIPFLTNYLETLLSMVWYPATVATNSRLMRMNILKYLEETGDPNLIDFKLHDFGYRGSTSPESAGIGAGAHLISFSGTDTLAGISFHRKYYGEKMAGFSIPAAEHSTITSWGRNHEKDAYENMLNKFREGLVAVVSDSYDVYHACEKIWGEELRDRVLKRSGTLIVRPDSGYPPEVVVKVLNILGEKFGFSVNRKGYKVLDPHVRVIQGDGIDLEMVTLILEAMKKEKWSADNVAFGSGGGLLQKFDRDTLKFAFKCSAVERSDGWHDDIMKDPITDHGKKSKAGRLKLINDGSIYRTVKYQDSDFQNILVPVFRNGEVLKEYSLKEIRARAKS